MGEVFTHLDKSDIIVLMAIVERDPLDFGVEHFRGVNTMLEVAAGNTLSCSANPILFTPSETDQLYVLTDYNPVPRTPYYMSVLTSAFKRPGLTLGYDIADATRLNRYYGSFDAVFMRNFLGDPRISDDDKCSAIEESLLSLRTPTKLGASALWAVETYTPDIAEWFILKLLDAFPIFKIERATITAKQAEDDVRFSPEVYPIRLNVHPSDQDIYKISLNE